MMDQMIIITLILISTFSIVNGQLRCYVCTNCPNLDDLDESVSQPCDSVSPPNTPTSSPITTPSTISTPTTTNTPNTPPTATSSPPTIMTSAIDDVVYESIFKATTNGLTNETTEQSRTSREISPGPPYRNGILRQLSSETSEAQLCFRIQRTVNDRTEVVRGCVTPANTEHQTCVRANDGVSPRTCRICRYDNCNTAKQNTSTSIVLMFTSIVTMTFLR